jgi:hypothetical protein
LRLEEPSRRPKRFKNKRAKEGTSQLAENKRWVLLCQRRLQEVSLSFFDFLEVSLSLRLSARKNSFCFCFSAAPKEKNSKKYKMKKKFVSSIGPAIGIFHGQYLYKVLLVTGTSISSCRPHYSFTIICHIQVLEKDFFDLRLTDFWYFLPSEFAISTFLRDCINFCHFFFFYRSTI